MAIMLNEDGLGSGDVRLVDANKMLSEGEHSFPYNINFCDEGDLNNWVLSQPTVDAEPVVHAHWEKYNDIYGDVCSHCGEASAPDMNYRHCPWCGAKMDENIGKGNSNV